MDELFVAVQNYIREGNPKAALALMLIIPEVMGRFCYLDDSEEIITCDSPRCDDLYKRWLDEAFWVRDKKYWGNWLTFDIFISLRDSLANADDSNEWSFGDYQFEVKRNPCVLTVSQLKGVNLTKYNKKSESITCIDLLEKLYFAVQRSFSSMRTLWKVTKAEVEFLDIEERLSCNKELNDVPKIHVDAIDPSESDDSKNDNHEKLKQVNRIEEDNAKKYILPDADEVILKRGCNVTKFTKDAHQPRGGYLSPKLFQEIKLEGDETDVSNENVSPSLVGAAVDYLTRFLTGTPDEDAFKIPFYGAWELSGTIPGIEDVYWDLLSQVFDLSDSSIIAAIKLTGFDSSVRAGVHTYRPIEEIRPNNTTIRNVRDMVNKSLKFFDIYGPKVLDEIRFTPSAFTKRITSGDGDFLTSDTLWDFKVSKLKLLPKYTLQLLIYWRLCMHSSIPEYRYIRHLGFFNPRLNKVYMLDTYDIDMDLIEFVDKDIIGYSYSQTFRI